MAKAKAKAKATKVTAKAKGAKKAPKPSRPTKPKTAASRAKKAVKATPAKKQPPAKKPASAAGTKAAAPKVAAPKPRPAAPERVSAAMLDTLASGLDAILPSADPTAVAIDEREREFRRGFRDHAVPTLLARLLEFALAHEGRPYAPEFALTTAPSKPKPMAVLDRWFGSSAWRKDGTDLIRFGAGVADGIIALWLYPGRTVESAPVVYLDSAGVGNGVIAGDLREFFSLLATNRPFYGWSGDEPDFGDPSQDTAAANTELRHWLRANLRIDPAADPITTSKAARARHPDFQAWVSTVRVAP